jgi:hypothetical protein
MRYPTDDGVDAYIKALRGWQQAICQEVRELVHGTDPEVVETTKRKGQPYFVLAGNMAVGWPTGLEPVTFGARIQRFTAPPAGRPYSRVPMWKSPPAMLTWRSATLT